MSHDRSADGLSVRQEVLGADYVARSLEALTEYRKPLMELVTDYGWGSVWTRPGLDRATRSLITIAAMTALRHQGELAVHVRGALRQGVTPAEIQEVLLHLAVYCGAPAAAEAFATVEAALTDLGYSDEQLSPSQSGFPRSQSLPCVGTKIVLLFRTIDGRPNASLRAALEAEVGRLQARLPAALTSGAGIGIDPESVQRALEALGSGGRRDFGSPGYQGLLWVAGPAGTLDELTAAVSGVGTRLGDLIDPGQSAAVAGTEEVFLPGDGPLAGMYAIRRRPGDTHEHFHDFWRLEHTKLSMHIPGFRYRQLHAATYASERAAVSAGVEVADVDGVVEYFFDDIQYQIDMTQLENFPEIYADEKNFIDHDRSTFTYVDLLS